MSMDDSDGTIRVSRRPPEVRHADARAVVAALKPAYPVYCVRPKVIERLAGAFLEQFPGRVLYAVKCNPHPMIIKALYEAGIRHFDTASLAEVAQVRELYRDAECYFMHPIKSRAAIRTADEVYEVEHFVVDHLDELNKVLDAAGGEGITILVRIATPSAGAAYDLSQKFGAKPAEAVELLRAIKAEGCIAGLCFHVGSQCTSPRAFRTALEIAGDVIAAAKVDIHYLDVGGGFPAAYAGVKPPPLERFIEEIDAGLAPLKLRRDCVLMCEPGRALVADALSLITQVQLRKGDALYINDGIYGSLSEAVTARLRFPVRPIRLDGPFAVEHAEFTVYGPTCDSTDLLPQTVYLPADIREGDWIEFGQIGAYSNALATRFNGFYPDAWVAVDDDALLPED